MRVIVDLAEADADTIDLVGGKAAGLGRMIGPVSGSRPGSV